MLKAGEQLTDFITIQAEVGAGSFARVYQATHQVMKRTVAVKELVRGQAHGDSTKYEKYARQFQHEVEVLAGFNHANIVQVYEIITTQDASYLVMEYIEGMQGVTGKSLKQWIEQRGALPLEQALAIGRDVLAGLAAVHEDGRGIVHRDLKPSNILLKKNGLAKIADFGLAQLYDESQRSLGGPAHPGTPPYMSPEQESTTGYLYPASDIFSFGCVVFEMLTGKGYKRAKGDGESLAELRPGLPDWLAALLERMLAKDPDQRPRNGREALQLWQDGIEEEIEKLRQAGRAALSLSDEPGVKDVLGRLEKMGEEGKRAAARLKIESIAQQKRARELAEQRRENIERDAQAAREAIAQERWLDAEALLAVMEGAGEDGRRSALPLRRELEQRKQDARRQAEDEKQRLAQENAAQEAAQRQRQEQEEEQRRRETQAQREERGRARSASLRRLLPWLAGAVLLAALSLGGYYGIKSLRQDRQERQQAGTTQTASVQRTAAVQQTAEAVEMALALQKEDATETVMAQATLALQQTAAVQRTAAMQQTAAAVQATLAVQPTAARATQFAQATAYAQASLLAQATQQALVEAYTPTPDLKVLPDCTATGQTWTSPQDGMVLVCVPAGEFRMGAESGDTDAYRTEKPAHDVGLDAYWIDRTEVTNAMFAQFVQEMGYQTQAEVDGKSWVWSSSGWSEVAGANWQHPNGPETTLVGLGQHPVVQVSWNDAVTYCEWAGRELPTEAQWEKAARGADARTYPWGNEFSCKNGNFDDETTIDSDVVEGGAGCDGYDRTAPVGSFPAGASPYRAQDMAGNVWEWVRDWYGEKYYDQSPAENPLGPASGDYRSLRGGSWYSLERLVRASYRDWDDPSLRGNLIGFRCSRQ